MVCKHHAQNPLLLVKPLASITLQVSLDPAYRSTLKKSKKTNATNVKISPKIKITLIELDLDTRKGTQCARRTNKHLQLDKFKRPLKYDSNSNSFDSEVKLAKKKRLQEDILNLPPTQLAPSMSLTHFKIPHLIVVEEEITSPRKEMPNCVGKKVKHRHSKLWMERLEKSMMDLANNQTAICPIFDTLVEFSTKVIHFASTTL